LAIGSYPSDSIWDLLPLVFWALLLGAAWPVTLALVLWGSH